MASWRLGVSQSDCVFPGVRGKLSVMLRYFKFRDELFAPQPGKDVYVKRAAGKGWPEQCPPVRAGNSFGFDLLANFDVTFVQSRGEWRVMKDIVIPSDFDYA